jgi:hypothetical protein
VAGLIQRLRHSPGVTRRESTQDANETGCASDSRVCDVSRFHPLHRELHAVCQRGAGGNRLGSENWLRGAKRRGIRASLTLSACCWLLTSDIDCANRYHRVHRHCYAYTVFVPSWENRSGTPIQFGAVRSSSFRLRAGTAASLSSFDTGVLGLNNPSMPRPETAHRVKSYSAATGYVYQYYFYEVEKVKRARAEGTEYVYMASVDRKHVFPVRIFVAKEALGKWSARTGREFTGTEEYALAKMRLFQAFDEVEGFSEKTPALTVDESNLEALLSQLDL